MSKKPGAVQIVIFTYPYYRIYGSRFACCRSQRKPSAEPPGGRERDASRGAADGVLFYAIAERDLLGRFEPTGALLRLDLTSGPATPQETIDLPQSDDQRGDPQLRCPRLGVPSECHGRPRSGASSLARSPFHWRAGDTRRLEPIRFARPRDRPPAHLYPHGHSSPAEHLPQLEKKPFHESKSACRVQPRHLLCCAAPRARSHGSMPSGREAARTWPRHRPAPTARCSG